MRVLRVPLGAVRAIERTVSALRILPPIDPGWFATRQVKLVYSSERAKRELGWKPKATLESGIRQTVRWYLENEEWVRDVTSGGYRQWVATHYSG